jgi:hypothetical protein
MTTLESIIDELALCLQQWRAPNIEVIRKHLPDVLEDWLIQRNVTEAARAFLKAHGPSDQPQSPDTDADWDNINGRPEYIELEQALTELDQERLEKGLG